MGWVENLKRFGLQGTVDLNSERVGPIGAGQLGNLLAHNTTVENLDLRETILGPEGARHVARMLMSNTTLVTLDLTSNSVEDEGATALAHALKGNSKLALVKLELQRNGISADGARELADALRHNTSIQYLGLAFNGFGDAGAAYVAQVLSGSNRWLRHLDLGFNGVCAQGACGLCVLPATCGGGYDQRHAASLYRRGAAAPAAVQKVRSYWLRSGISGVSCNPRIAEGL